MTKSTRSLAQRIEIHAQRHGEGDYAGINLALSVLFATLSSCCTGCWAWICVLSSAMVMSSAFRSDCKLSICC